MVPIMASFGYASTFYDDRGMPDPLALPEAYEGVLWRRIFAYFVDLCVIGVTRRALLDRFCRALGPQLWTAGARAVVSFRLIPLAYQTLLLSGPRSATVGMRLFDVELRSVTGERPTFLQALIQTALFYITVGATCSLVLLLVLFNRHKRTLHDMLAGTVMVRRFPVRWATAQHTRGPP